MVEHEGDGLGIEAGVEAVEHGPDHGNGKMGLHHGRDIGQDHGHRVAFADTLLGQGRGETAHAGIGLLPSEVPLFMHDTGEVGMDMGGAGEKTQRAEGHMIGRVPVQPG